MSKIYWGLILVFSVFYLILAVNTPLSLIVWQRYDDMLFINHAQSLTEGRWLGQFSELTLIKGPGYPFFLALNYWIGLPISFTQALLRCIAFAMLALLIVKVSKSYLLALLVFLIALWDPRILELSRILRGTIYPSQAVLVITLFSFSLFFFKKDVRRYVLPVICGLMLGWFWLTREEGIWLMPGLIFLSLYAAIRNKYQPNSVGTLLPISIIFVIFVATQLSFSYANMLSYGKFVGVDIKEKNYQAAMKSMESIRVGEQIPFLTISRAVRKEIYKISPAFSEIKEYLDPTGKASPFEKGACQFRPATCGDIGNGFILWAVRETAAKKGHYSSPENASSYFRQVHDDIQNACNANQLECETNYIPYMPPITLGQFKMVGGAFHSLWKKMSSGGKLQTASRQKVTGTKQNFRRALSFLNYPFHYPGTGVSSDDDFLSNNPGYVFSLKMRTFLHRVYSMFMPYLNVCGILAFLVSCFFVIRRADYPIIWALAAVCWISVASRSVILVLVHISSFQAITLPYMQPLFTLSKIASILSFGVLVYFSQKGCLFSRNK